MIKADCRVLKLLLLNSLLFLLREDVGHGLPPEAEPVLEVVRHDGDLRVDPEHVGGCGGHGRPGGADVVRHGGRRDARLGEVCQQRREDVPAQFRSQIHPVILGNHYNEFCQSDA